jgi:hypothetical protein
VAPITSRSSVVDAVAFNKSPSLIKGSMNSCTSYPVGFLLPTFFLTGTDLSQICVLVPLYQIIMQPFLTAKSEQIIALLPPPPGVTPDFDHPVSIAYRLVITIAICLSASTIAILLRLYTKFFIVHIVGVDDCK